MNNQTFSKKEKDSNSTSTTITMESKSIIIDNSEEKKNLNFTSPTSSIPNINIGSNINNNDHIFSSIPNINSKPIIIYDLKEEKNLNSTSSTSSIPTNVINNDHISSPKNLNSKSKPNTSTNTVSTSNYFTPLTFTPLTLTSSHQKKPKRFLFSSKNELSNFLSSPNYEFSLFSILPKELNLKLNETFCKLFLLIEDFLFYDPNKEEICFKGNNSNGQSGLGDAEYRNTFTRINFEIKLNKICCGSNFTLFLTFNGDVYSMGSNQFGQLGLKKNKTSSSLYPSQTELKEDILIPTKIPNLSQVKDIACNSDYCMAYSEKNNENNQKFWIWGLFNSFMAAIGARSSREEYKYCENPLILNFSRKIKKILCCSGSGFILTEEGYLFLMDLVNNTSYFGKDVFSFTRIEFSLDQKNKNQENDEKNKEEILIENCYPGFVVSKLNKNRENFIWELTSKTEYIFFESDCRFGNKTQPQRKLTFKIIPKLINFDSNKKIKKIFGNNAGLFILTNEKIFCCGEPYRSEKVFDEIDFFSKEKERLLEKGFNLEFFDISSDEYNCLVSIKKTSLLSLQIEGENNQKEEEIVFYKISKVSSPSNNNDNSEKKENYWQEFKINEINEKENEGKKIKKIILGPNFSFAIIQKEN